jgi:hypothetical protein
MPKVNLINMIGPYDIPKNKDTYMGVLILQLYLGILRKMNTSM